MLRYYLDTDTGCVWSSCDRRTFYGPVLDFAAMGPTDGFATRWRLERLTLDWRERRGLRPIRSGFSAQLRNLHRAAWGRRMVPCADPAQLALFAA